ncbi:MAG: uroporphyrinogen-III C-methyltransferase [Bythopirellula sp.]|nr:uroporphyrinogen-III C-methyltransferase [Bythopirellula sp.]
MTTKTGKVYLVGAGPGEPTLITLRGFELLKQAEVIFYDYLVDPVALGQAGLLDESRTPPELVCLGRHGEGRLLSQAEINEQMVAAAQSGKMVVRLKGGDPAIFGRTAEEIAALEAANIPYEVVPGVTSALAASSYTGIPFTHRDVSSCVAIVTGQECRDKEFDSLDLAGLAKFPGTLVFYMGVTTAPRWSTELIAHGKPAATPVAIIRRATFADQQVVKTTLGELADVLAPKKMRPPAIIVVGEVVNAATETTWFTATQQAAVKPLQGKLVLLTRPAHQSAEMLRDLHTLGATTLCQPAIEISAPAAWQAVDRVIAELPTFDWLVFSSANGVNYFLNRLLETGHDLRQLGSCQLATIGSATAEALQAFHLRTDLQPAEYRAEALAEELAPQVKRKRVLLLRASRGREVLAEMLTAAGAEVSQVVVYESRDVEHPAPQVLPLLQAGRIHWITVTSSAIARSLVKMFGDDLKKARLVAISPLTAEVLSEAGYAAAAVATEYTTAGVIQAIVGAE